MIRAAITILKAYMVASLLRNKAMVISILQMALWMALFISPMILFSSPLTPKGVTAAYAFIAVLVFLSYNMAGWDWAWSLRQMMARGILEHFMISGRSFLLLYAGLMPVGLLWIGLGLGVVYAIMALLYAPPALTMYDPCALAIGLTILFTVLIAYSLVLGSSMLVSGTGGPVVELLSWILPIATGGLTPLVMYPPIMRYIALSTPFSYPAELIRYGLLGAPTALPVNELIMIGIPYSALFLTASYIVLRLSINKIRREGVRGLGLT